MVRHTFAPEGVGLTAVCALEECGGRFAPSDPGAIALHDPDGRLLGKLCPACVLNLLTAEVAARLPSLRP